MPEISKTYDPKLVEDQWYERWTESGCFEADPSADRDKYCIMIPPPNVTGVLTMGHVLNNTIQDILIRRARQQGLEALWLPGTDHAGIATQARVERVLREEGTNRHELGRERFLERAVEWRDRHGGIILNQLRKLGASCDWNRTVHTLDPDYSRAVLAAFVELFRRGYIYRGRRMVNWCPASLTALSDEEVIMRPQASKLYYMRYELADADGEFLEIATTRPETIMGDTGVAVHPGDERYRHLVGREVWRPFPRERIPIVADEAIDPEFGTGVLKVTPAHDALDFEIGGRNGLPVRDVFTPDGHLNELAGEPFAGMERFEARKKAAALLEELGLLIRVEEHENNVGFSERADVPIEPRLSDQWFLRYPKVEEAKRAVRDGHIRFFPQRWEKTYLHWMENIRDWCISRQLWWGHRIPVWYRRGADRADPANWHVSIEGPADPENWEQEEDVLDTWASSWLWPLATLGWPDEAEMRNLGFHAFFPTSALVTGPDIIFFWVARMIMAALEFGGEEKATLTDGEIAARVPFRDVYFTGIIRDLDGRKMSKSLGNSPDPLDLIARFGADGLRFGIMSIAPQGQDIRFGEERVEQGRNFCNKLWNACRFRQMSGPVSRQGGADDLVRALNAEHLDRQDHAILSRLLDLVEETDSAYETYSFSGITQLIHGFFWSDFCDWYLEVSKPRVQDPDARATVLAVQDLVFRQLLIVLHPFCPFITEELWHRLGFGSEDLFIGNVLPLSAEALFQAFERAGIHLDRGAVAEVDAEREAVSQLRSLKAEHGLANRRDVPVRFLRGSAPAGDESPDVPGVIELMAGLGDIEVVGEAPEGLPAVLTPLGTFFLDLASSVDVGAETERIRKEIARIDTVIEGIRKRLSNAAFVEKAPAEVVAGAQRQLEENETRRGDLERLLDSLRGG